MLIKICLDNFMKTNRYSQNPPMFRNHPFSFIITILLIFAFGLGILIFLIWYLKCKSTKIIVSNDELEFEKGLLSKERIEIKLNMIRSVKVNQSFFQRIFCQNPFQNLRKTRPIILNRSQPPSTTPDPFYIGFTFFIFFVIKKFHFFEFLTQQIGYHECKEKWYAPNLLNYIDLAFHRLVTLDNDHSP